MCHCYEQIKDPKVLKKLEQIKKLKERREVIIIVLKATLIFRLLLLGMQMCQKVEEEKEMKGRMKNNL